MRNFKEIGEKFLNYKILNLIYPPVCGICGKLNENFLCEKCKKALETEAVFGVDNIIENNIKYFDEHIYIFQYEGIIRRLILKYKFKEEAYLYKTFVNFLLKNKKLFEKIKKYDKIIPVPISQKRLKQRGYNQSELIAKEIAHMLNKKVETECLLKTKNIVEQSKLNKEDRIKNIHGVYELINKEKLFDKKILLVDDIYTTGSTVSECAKELKKARPREIGVFTLAKD